MPIEPLYLIGAGGHAKVVLDALASMNHRPVRLCDHDPRRVGQIVLGHTVETVPVVGAQRGLSFHVAIGDGHARRSTHSTLIEAGATPASVVHSAAVVAASATIGVGSFVAAQAVVAPDARVGNGVIVNHGAIVDHDCVVGDFSHVAPNATLGGGVRIGTAVMIGAGATILPGVRIGEGSIIAAGATIVGDVAPGETVIFTLTRKN